MHVRRCLLLIQSPAKALLLASFALITSLRPLLLIRLFFLSVALRILVRLALLNWLRFRLINRGDLLIADLELILVISCRHEEASCSRVLLINESSVSSNLLAFINLVDLIVAHHLLSCPGRVEAQSFSAVCRTSVKWVRHAT